MANYSMNDLQRLTGRTPQSIRQVFKKVESLKKLMAEHRKETPNKKVYYDDAILEALLEYYGLSKNNPAVADEVGGGVEDTENPENPQINPPPPVEANNNPSAAAQEQIEGLQAKIEALEKQLQEQAEAHQRATADLEKQLQDKEAERLHFIGENAKLISLLTAEKQEKDKLLLLMPPQEHKTVWQKVKGLFTRKEGGKNE